MQYRKFICQVCGHVYDEALGDPAAGLAAGTRWEDIPDDWVCSDCGASKADFKVEECVLS
jgi:rubredoxin